MGIKEYKRAKITGKGARRSFLGLPHEMVNSDEFGNLSAHATKMLVELARQYKGRNNGDLSAPWSRLHRRGWKSKSTLWDALRELQGANFILQTRQGGKHRVCALYAVTWHPVDDCDGKHDRRVETVASNAWRKSKNEVAMRTSEFAMRTSEPEKPSKAA